MTGSRPGMAAAQVRVLTLTSVASLMVALDVLAVLAMQGGPAPGTADRMGPSGATLVTATGPVGSGLASGLGFGVVLGGELEDLR